MKAWLRDLPTSALVTFTGCVCAFLTALFYFGSAFANVMLDDGNFNAWLLFVAALLGVGYQQFSKKRTTEDPEVIRAHADAAVKKTESVAANSPPLTLKEIEDASSHTGE